MRDVVIWCWGAFVMFGVFATYNQTFYQVNMVLAAILAVFSTIAFLGAVLFFVWKIKEHWNCKAKS